MNEVVEVGGLLKKLDRKKKAACVLGYRILKKTLLGLGVEYLEGLDPKTAWVLREACSSY